MAGACFILPAAAVVTVIASVYVKFGTVPAVAGLLYGDKPVVIGVIVQALWWLGRTALKTRGLAVLVALATAAAAAGVHELANLALAGAAMTSSSSWP